MPIRVLLHLWLLVGLLGVQVLKLVVDLHVGVMGQAYWS